MGDSVEFIIEEKRPPSPLVVSSDGVSHQSGNNNAWPTLKPFVNGFLTGQLNFLQACAVYMSFQKMLPLAYGVHHPRLVAEIKNNIQLIRKRFPVYFLSQATYTTARFGSFETLTKKVEAANGNFPITLYQEACCGLISGAIGSCVWHPLRVASASLIVKSSQSVETQFNYRNLFDSLYHKTRSEGLFALWKGSGIFIPKEMVLNMGLLTSYSRSLYYFRESVGLTKTQAQLGAGIVSAFFAAICVSPWPYIAAIKDIIQADGGRKYSYRDSLFCISRVLRHGGQFKLYSGIFKSFRQCAPYVVIQWLNLETIREVEEFAGF